MYHAQGTMYHVLYVVIYYIDINNSRTTKNQNAAVLSLHVAPKDDLFNFVSRFVEAWSTRGYPNLVSPQA